MNTKKKKSRTLAPAAVLLAGILWGSMGIFVRKYNTWGLESLQIVAIRACVTAILLLLGLLLFRRELLKIRWKDIWCFLGTGLCSILFFNYCYFKTITLTSLSVAAVLLYTAPAMVMVMSAFLFEEKFNSRKCFALFLAFGGCVLVTGLVGSELRLTAAGILTGFGAGFGYALYSIFSRFALQKGYHSLTIMAYTFLFAALGVIPMVEKGSILRVVSKSPETILFTLIFAIVSTVLPYFVYTWGLQYVENGAASILASVEPVMASLIGVFLFREKISLPELCGIIMVLVSVVICSRQEGD